MKKASKPVDDDLRPEYDLRALSGGVRGKYARMLAGRVRLVPLDPDLAAAFPTDESVNQALRAILTVAEGIKKPRRAAKK